MSKKNNDSGFEHRNGMWYPVPENEEPKHSIWIPRKLEGKTEGQNRLIDALAKSDVTICDGPAGTGKTYIVVGKAMELVREGSLSQIVVCRPSVLAGEDPGFLPGDMSEKYGPFVEPIYEAVRRFCRDDDEYKQAIDPKTGYVKLRPLAYMRGLNFRKSFAILDEAQNATYDQIKMFVSRLYRGSKAAIVGSSTQCDLQNVDGFCGAIDRITNYEYRQGIVSFVRLTRNDIVRSGLVKELMEAMES